MYKNEDFFMLIGRITVYFSTLDMQVSILISKTVCKNTKNILKNESTLGNKLFFLKNLKKDNFYFLEFYNEIHNVIDEIIEVSKERNRYIHDAWLFNPDDVSKGAIKRYRFKCMDNFKFEFDKDEYEIVSIQDISAFEIKLLKCQQIISNLANKYNSKLESTVI